MSYQIVARVDPFADGNSPSSVEHLASQSSANRLASLPDVHVERDRGFVEFRVYVGDEDSVELTRKFCGALIDSGILAFEISHAV